MSGALAQNVWGIPRTSGDIDILMVCPAIRIPALVEDLRKGASAQVELAGALESLRKEYVLRCLCGPIPCELFVPNLPYHSAVLARAVLRPILGVADVQVATAEDIIVLKVLFDRDQDWADIEGILIRQAATGSIAGLDLEHVRGWVGQMIPETNPRIARLERLVEQRAVRPGWRVYGGSADADPRP